MDEGVRDEQKNLSPLVPLSIPPKAGERGI
jgi:hypothetical protein